MGDLFLECLFWIRSVMAEICLFRHSNCTLFMYCKYDDVWPVIGTALLLVAVHDPFPPLETTRKRSDGYAGKANHGAVCIGNPMALGGEKELGLCGRVG